MHSKNIKIIASFLACSTLISFLSPTVTVLASEQTSLSKTISQSDENSFVLDENNENYQNGIKYLEREGNSQLVQYYKEYFYGKTVTTENKQELLEGFIDYINSKPTSRIAIETIIGIIAGAITVTKGMYEAGRYAAKQCVSRGLLSKKDYKPKGGWIMAGITAAFGIPAALGFDDYMYDR